MIAVLGTGASEHASEIAEAHDLTVANDNSPMQVVISGAKSRAARCAGPPRSWGCARWS